MATLAQLLEEEKLAYERRRQELPHLYPPREVDHPRFDSSSCIYRGEVCGRTPVAGENDCSTCGNPQADVFRCGIFGECTIDKQSVDADVKRCIGCERQQQPGPTPNPEMVDLDDAPQAHAIAPMMRHRVQNLAPDPFQLNNSILRFNGEYVMAWRKRWESSQVWISRLDDAFNAIDNQRLAIHPSVYNALGVEDPRLFVYRGALHVCYTGVQSHHGGLRTHVMYSRLDHRLQVEQTFLPAFDGRRDWEKNWGFFEHHGDLFAVYSVSPHVVLKITGDTAKLASVAKWDQPEALGLMRGGASPTYYRGEFWSFAHGCFNHQGKRWYVLTPYTFEPKPPFRPSRVLPQPLLIPTVEDLPQHHVPHVVYPAGAFEHENKWHVSFGYYDRWSEIATWDVNKLDLAMEVVPGGAYDGVAFRDLDATHDDVHVKVIDRTVWHDVFMGNEYQLPARLDPDELIIDIGSNIGAFTCACLERGARRMLCYEPSLHAITAWQANVNKYPHNRARISRCFKEHTCGAKQHDVRIDTSEFPDEPIQLLKIDCEGAEYDIIKNRDLSNVKKIVGEAHRFGEWETKDIIPLLEAQGFEVRFQPNGENTALFWATK